MAGSIGSVSITVDADASDVPSQVEKATSGPLAKIGASMGKALSASLAAAIDPKAATSALQSGFQSALSRLGSTAQSALAPVTALGQNFVRGFNDAAAASSELTGKMGSLGGAAAKALSPAITGVQNFISGFRSADAALSSFTGKMGAVGGVARTAWNVASAAASAFAPAAQKALSAVASAASKTWDAIKKGASAAWSAIAAGMKGTLETGARIAGTAVAATLGAALTKGFGRLEAIDTAEAKLAGLGITGDKLAKTMDAATNAVKGTSFGLGEAASAAASFSAAGVPIDGMERSLSILASTAAVGGSSLSEMGTIFGKVAATGKVNGEVLQQLAERGVPALSLLADSMGVTADEASKMVSSGQVDFETFQTAMEAGLGPAAQAMGQSFSGMMANVGAALGRTGAEAQKPIFEALKTVMPGVISLLDQVTAAITPVATVIGSYLAPAAQKLADFLSGINFQVTADGASGFVAALGPLLPVIGGLLGAMGPLLTNLPVIGGLFSSLTGPVGIFAGALAALALVDPSTLTAGFEAIAGALPGIISGIVAQVTTLIPQLVSNIATNLPIFVTGILNLFMALIPALTTAIPLIVQTFATLIPTIITTLLGAIPTILTAALELFSGIITAIITVLPQIVASLVAMLPQLATAVITALPLIIQAALDLFMGVIQGLVTATPVIIDAVMALLPELITTLLGMLPTIIDSALQLFLGVVTGLLTAIPQIITSLLNMLPQLISTLLGMIPTLIQGAVQLFTGIVKALPIIIPKLIDALVKLGPTMVSTLIGLVPQLLQAGVDLIGGLVSGLWQAAGSVGSALLEIAQNAIGDFLGFLGIRSPSRVFMTFGRNIIDGLAIGLKKSSSSAVKEMQSTAKQIAKAVDTGVISRRTGNALLSQLNSKTTAIRRALTSREQVLGRLKTAEKSLADIVADRAKFASGVTEDVLGLGNIGGKKTAESMILSLQKRVAATAKFRDTIAQLTKAGLDKASIEELTSGFAQSGSTKAADALLASGTASIKEVAKLRNQLAGEATKLGNTVGNSLYNTGIQAASGLVKGLKSQAAALQSAANKTADSLVAAIKKRLGIRSPSRVLAGVGGDTMAGYVKGILDAQGAVEDAFSTVMPRDALTPIPVSVTSLAPGSGVAPAAVAGATDNRRIVNVAEGAIQASGSDDRKVALEVLDAIAEEASL